MSDADRVRRAFSHAVYAERQKLARLEEPERQHIVSIWQTFGSATPTQRELILRGILSQCHFSELSAVGRDVANMLRIDFLKALPPEVAYKILFYLDAAGLCAAAQVSRHWRALADDDLVWHRMCEQHIDRKCTKCGWGLPLLERRRLRAYRKVKERKAAAAAAAAAICEPTQAPNSNGKRGMHDTAALDPSCADPAKAQLARPWKDVYAERCKIERNWRKLNYIQRQYDAHQGTVTCIAVEDDARFDASHAENSGVMATGSEDGTITMRCLRDGHVMQTLVGHQGAIRCLQFDDCMLVSGDDSGLICVWDYHKGRRVTQMEGHTGPVLSLQLEGSRIVSGSADRVVKLWDFAAKTCCVLRGHTQAVNAVRLDGAAHRVYSGSDDGTVRIWDTDTRECLQVTNAHAAAIKSLVLLPSRDAMAAADDATLRRSVISTVATAGIDGTVKCWDSDMQQCVRTLFGHLEPVVALSGDSLHLLSASLDRSLKLWDVHSGECKHTISIPQGCGTPSSIALSDRFIIYGDDQGKVFVLNFSSQQ